MPTAVSYARYSSELQKDSSIEDQQALCRRYAEREGFTIKKEYSDRALSGASLFGRQGIAELLADAKARTFTHVIVEALDRISRDQEDTAYVYKRLSFAGVTIQTVHDGPVDAIQVGIRGLVGSLYLKDLGLKVHRGLAARTAAGKNPGGCVYGYKPVRGESGEMEIDEAEAAIVKRIFVEFANGDSTLTIAKRLNRDGIASPRGGVWFATALLTNGNKLGGILRCEQYQGVRVWNRSKGVLNPDSGRTEFRPNPESGWQRVEVPQFRLVEDEIWQRVAQRIAEGKNRVGPRIGRPLETGTKRLLTGLLYCGACGGRMKRASGTKRGPLITCRFQGVGTCSHKRYYKLEKIEAVVTEMVARILADPTAAASYAEQYIELRRKENAQMGKTHKQALKALNDAKAAKERVLDLHVRGLRGIDETETKVRALMVEIAECEKVLARTPDAPNVDYHPQAVKAYREALETMAEKGNDPAMDEYRLQLRNLVSKVIIHPVPAFQAVQGRG